MSEEDVKQFSKLFEAIDLDREDSISFNELECVIKILTTLEGDISEEHVLAVRHDSSYYTRVGFTPVTETDPHFYSVFPLCDGWRALVIPHLPGERGYYGRLKCV